MTRPTCYSSDNEVKAEAGGTASDSSSNSIDLSRAVASEGYFLDEDILKRHLGLVPGVHLKTAPNGEVLLPQPSDDPQDPLNWSAWRKLGILVVVIVNSFTTDYSIATGTGALVPQAKEWGRSTTTINHATVGMNFMVGVGGLATVWMSAYIGRLPVLFWSSLVATGTAAWAATASTFESYMAARILNGTFVAAAASGGLMWLKDVWFFHEYPNKVNIWATSIVLSPYLGPQCMAAITSVSNWRAGMWLCFGIIAFGVLCTVALGDETFYPRHLLPEKIPARRSRMLRLMGVEQVRTNWTTNTFLESGSRLGYTLLKLPVFLALLYYFLDFSWTVGINQTISVFIIPEYHLSYRDLAKFYTAPIVGAILALLVGHFAFDAICAAYAKYHNGQIEPENRLIMLWLIFPPKIVGHVLIGCTLQQRWSFWALLVGWAMHNFCMVLTTAAVGAYLIDAYPEASGESGAWLNFARTLGGFILGYVQISWAKSAGTQQEYGIQSAIMSAAFVIVIGLQFYGVALRRRSGPLNFRTN